MAELRIGLVGATGRMGRAVLLAIESTPGMVLGHAQGRGTGFTELLMASDVIIDFSSPGHLMDLAEACAEAGKPLVSGTTGLDDAQRRALAAAGQKTAIVFAPNMSIGINIIAYLVDKTSEILNKNWKVSIFEAHHVHKKDAPSGTALRLGEVVEFRHGKGSVNYEVVREGETIGHHRVCFNGPGERIVLEHEATDRGIFATGALKAAVWVVDQPPGLYGMADVLGLK